MIHSRCVSTHLSPSAPIDVRAACPRLCATALLALLGSLISPHAAPLHGADCNGNGVEDELEVGRGDAEDCNLNGVPDTCEGPPLALDSVSNVELDGDSRSVMAKDFNADGLMDLAFGHSSGATILLQRPIDERGEFREDFFDSRHLEIADTRIRSWGASDMDADGHQDLVYVNTDAVVVLYGDGSDQFTSSTEGVEVARGSHALAVGDLNGDGLTDVVVTTLRVDTVEVLLSRSNRRLEEVAELPVDEFPIAVELLDVDADADIDIVTGNRNANSLTVVENHGDAFALSEETIEIEKPEQLTVADLNGDGRGELIIAARGEIHVLMATTSGLRPETVVTAEGLRPTDVTCGDIDRDGDLDVIASYLGGSVVVARNGGDGQFDALSPLPFRVAAGALIGGDFDGDSADDLALPVLSEGRAVMVWQGRIPDARASQVVVSAESLYPTLGEPHGATVADMDGDGFVDVITANNRDFAGISVLRNQGDGTLSAPVQLDAQGRAFTVVAGDLNGDGNLDLTVGLRGLGIETFVNDGGGNLSSQFFIDLGANVHTSAGDFDGDDDLDVLSTDPNRSVILLNRGDGQLVVSNHEPTLGAASVVGDFDDDNDVDIATARTDMSDVALLLNRGDGSFEQPRSLPLLTPSFYLASADLDGDGRLDFAAVSGESVSILWNQGDGQFGSSQPLEFTPLSVSLADVNGDGHVDLLGGSQRNTAIDVVLNLGNRRFALDRQSIAIGGSGPRFVFGQDLDGDGDAELISANHDTQNVSVFENLETTTERGDFDFLEQLCTELDFFRASVPLGETTPNRATKFIVPARDDETLLGVLFQNVNRFQLHESFLAEVFPNIFSGGTRDEYNRLVGRRATRDFYVGVLSRLKPETEPVFAFSVVADTGFDVREVLQLEEIEWVHTQLTHVFSLGELAYDPDTQLARDEAETWTNPPFPILSEGVGLPESDYEPYTRGVGYGRVRVLTLAEFEAASRSGRFTLQDIVVVDEVPQDIEGVVSGVITGQPQGNLSHIAVRTARRGTPNAFIAGATDKLAGRDGELVRFEVLDTGYSIEPAQLSEAEEFWDQSRPSLPQLPTVDSQYGGLDHLFDFDVALDGASVSRFGGKATNLSRLQTVLTGPYAQYREIGFAIPMRYYLDFMQSNSFQLDDRTLSYEELLFELLDDPDVQTDSERRFTLLDDFRSFARREGVVDPMLVASLTERIRDVFGATDLMVRFRSSSNVEDGLEFNGAGLYESTSVCAADTIDPATPDASHCDPSRNSERTVERALKKVWTSLWTFRAHEERTFFQIPREAASMGILVNRAFLDEKANGVAFTGNPTNAGDRRYVVTAQLGEASSVSPEPGVRVERNFLEVVDGEVIDIFRNRSSSLVPPGEVVMTDAQLRELGALMAHVDENFPIELGTHTRDEVLLDFEFKVEADGSLAVKQVRPFLLTTTRVESPTFELRIPDSTSVCAVFSKDRTDRPPRTEYELKSMVHFRSGVFPLPTRSDSFALDLIDQVIFGPEQEIAAPVASGRVDIVRVQDADRRVIYRFSYAQRFTLPSGDQLEIEIFNLNFRGQGSQAIDEFRILDEEYLTFDLSMLGRLNGQPVVGYSSCFYELLPHFQIDVEFAGGRIQLEERFLESENLLSSGPASIVRADVTLTGQDRSIVGDYWKLVYAAARHNRSVQYWVLLEPPVVVDGLAAPVSVVEIAAPEPTLSFPGGVTLLGADFQPLANPALRSFNKTDVEIRSVYRRGDFDADGATNVNDAVALLNHLFRSAAAPPCAKAADTNDDGRLDLADAMTLLLHLFAGNGPLPQPSAGCGIDPTPDGLSCDHHAPCVGG